MTKLRTNVKLSCARIEKGKFQEEVWIFNQQKREIKDNGNVNGHHRIGTRVILHVTYKAKITTRPILASTMCGSNVKAQAYVALMRLIARTAPLSDVNLLRHQSPSTNEHLTKTTDNKTRNTCRIPSNFRVNFNIECVVVVFSTPVLLWVQHRPSLWI
jgi:hypothetical protein